MKSHNFALAGFFVAAVLAGCADPTEGKTDAIVGEAIEIDEAPVETAAPIETDDTATETTPPDPFSQPAEGSRAKAAAEGTIYVMEENSGVQFEGSKVTGSHVGGFSKYDGAVFVPESGNIEGMKIEITIDMTSVFSDAGGLTDKLKGEEFFDIKQFPTASFKSASVKKTDSGYDVTGNFNLHGVTKAITFPAEIKVAEDKLTAMAEFVIKQFDWGIKYRGLGEDLIRDEVLILLDIVAKPEGA